MIHDTAAAFLRLVGARRGHFRLESGHHGALWLDLDALFAQPPRIAPFAGALASAVGRYDVSAVCGPLLGGAFLAQLVAQSLGVEFWFTRRVPAIAQTGALYETGYVLPPSLVARARGHRVAIVDDVMSAGSALGATFSELRDHGARPVVAGALLVLGSTGAELFARHDVPVEAVGREAYDLWGPSACPLCAQGIPLEDVAGASAG